jgi:hypothetical protein
MAEPRTLLPCSTSPYGTSRESPKSQILTVLLRSSYSRLLGLLKERNERGKKIKKIANATHKSQWMTPAPWSQAMPSAACSAKQMRS